MSYVFFVSKLCSSPFHWVSWFESPSMSYTYQLIRCPTLKTSLDIRWTAGKVPYQVYHSVTINDSLSSDTNQCLLLTLCSVSKTSFRNADVGMTMTSNQSILCKSIRNALSNSRSRIWEIYLFQRKWGLWISNGERECRKVFPVEDLEEAVEVIRWL